MNPIEPWMRGILPDIHPVTGHLLRAIEQIREDTEATLNGLSVPQIWAKPHGMSSVGFHAKHLAGSTERLNTYLAGQSLTPEQLSAIEAESHGDESSAGLLAGIQTALQHYEDSVRQLKPEDFAAIREIGRKRYQTTAISVAIHAMEHAQRHTGGMIAAAKLVRALG